MLNEGTSTLQQTAPLPAIGPDVVVRGRYVVVEQLDHGRFGSVYRATDTQGNGRSVALLMVPPEAVRAAAVLEAFMRELARVQALRHPNIVKVLDFVRDGDLHAVVMEYVDGESLRAIVDSLRPERLWERDAVALVRAIGDALVYAHARGVVHGDVRLENVIVTAQHEVKVLFTSACLASSAPFAVEPRDDVRGLACIVYELLAGEPPFMPQTANGWQAKPKRLKNLTRRQWSVLRAVLIGRDDRMYSVSEFLDVLGAVGASATEERRPAEGDAPRNGWRWVAVAWAVALLTVGYVSFNGTSDEPAPRANVPESGSVIPETVVEPQPQPAVEAIVGLSAVANVDGRLAATPDSAVRVDARPAEGRIPPVPAAVSSVTFAQSAVTAAENAGVVTLELQRSGAVERAARVLWWTSPGTALAEQDYASFGTTVEAFRPGETVRQISIPITSDATSEGREQFTVHLREIEDAGTRIGAVAQVTVTLVDDDS